MAEPFQLPLFPDQASLTRIRPARDESRFYRLEVWPDLFGHALLAPVGPHRLRRPAAPRSPPGPGCGRQRPRPARPRQAPPRLPGLRRMTGTPNRQVATAKSVGSPPSRRVGAKTTSRAAAKPGCGRGGAADGHGAAYRDRRAQISYRPRT